MDLKFSVFLSVSNVNHPLLLNKGKVHLALNLTFCITLRQGLGWLVGQVAAADSSKQYLEAGSWVKFWCFGVHYNTKYEI